VLGTIEVLEAARTVEAQVVFSSTGGAIYGECDGPAPETAERRPLAPYGVSKLAGEEYLGAFNRLYGTRHVALRYGNVYGPRQDPHGEAGVVAIFLGKLAEGKAPRIFGDGSQSRDYVYAGDVARATLVGACRARRSTPSRRRHDSASCSGACSTSRSPRASSAGDRRSRSRRACGSPGSPSRASRSGAPGGESDRPPWSTPFRIQASPAPSATTPGARSPWSSQASRRSSC
jgi:hypothetical protein